MTRTAFVLGGGGVLGAAEAGMARALLEAGIVPDVILGTSIGAINGAVLATDPTPEVARRLVGMWDELGADDDLGGSVVGRIGQLLRTRTSLHSSDSLMRLLEEYLPERFDELAVEFQCVAASIERARERWFTKGPLRQAVLASSAALDRAVSLAEAGQVDTAHAQRWMTERDRIAIWINENCWSARRKSYTAYAGTEDLDAATLLAARTGFDQGERLAGTIAAIRDELCDGPLVYRYTRMAEEEGAFVACTFWLVNALVLNGRREEARSLMDQAVGLVNDVGLLAEEIDPATGEMLGNFPQGLSHLALINAACAYVDSA